MERKGFRWPTPPYPLGEAFPLEGREYRPILCPTEPEWDLQAVPGVPQRLIQEGNIPHTLSPPHCWVRDDESPRLRHLILGLSRALPSGVYRQREIQEFVYMLCVPIDRGTRTCDIDASRYHSRCLVRRPCRGGVSVLYSGDLSPSVAPVKPVELLRQFLPIDKVCCIKL